MCMHFQEIQRIQFVAMVSTTGSGGWMDNYRILAVFLFTPAFV